MKLSCYIVDDETHAIEVLVDHIANIKDLSLLGYNSNPVTALHEVNEKHPDVLFLDIDMPNLNGIEFSKLIKPDIRVIFTTASPNFALDAFEISAFDYLLKPISYSRFQRAINKLNQFISINDNRDARSAEKEDFFYIKCENKGKMVKINYDDIMYVESNSNYVIISTKDTKYNTYLTLKEIKERLPDTSFFRIHKSFVINHTKINYIDGNQVVLTDKSVLQLGNTYREAFFDLVNRHIIKTSRQ
ncbi:LytR/AlgR family response regulator transcription factor [Mucilaginibacter agri]|uniref:Response regulator n=1 Tax=Mucilaginibacter agri TaxID=2695265 RepID=A0A965ZG38_9SPHI|nr:LytTR family transcriptional regulator DNA-binding domain-containing protein [Mucilaginibacter agri]NCD70025.1 response regulator [Mucilaginibacter agri]